MVPKLLSSTEATRTYVDPFLRLTTNRVSAFDADGMCEIAFARVTGDVDFRLVEDWKEGHESR